MSEEMRELNKIVFDVYNSVLDMDYARNETIKGTILKLFRYIKTGYIFELKNAQIQMKKKNIFVETNNEYNKVKIAVYTVSTGKYDKIKEPVFKDSSIDYYAFTEQNIPKHSAWKRKNIPKELETLTSLEQARYIKTHPHLFFEEYDYSMFIDGNIRITCDIKPLVYTLIEMGKNIAIHRHQVRDCIYSEGRAVLATGKALSKDVHNQLRKYDREGFPKHYGLFETNIIIRNHNNEECINIMEDWWNEMVQWTKRDQLSFTYALWKNNKGSDYVMSLGNNSRRNPYFIVDSHR